MTMLQTTFMTEPLARYLFPKHNVVLELLKQQMVLFPFPPVMKRLLESCKELLLLHKWNMYVAKGMIMNISIIIIIAKLQSTYSASKPSKAFVFVWQLWLGTMMM